MQNESFKQPLAQQGQAGKENDSLYLIAFAVLEKWMAKAKTNEPRADKTLGF